MSYCCTTTRRHCGPFPKPENRDQGTCHSIPYKVTCEAPSPAVLQCFDENFEVAYDDDTGQFRFVATLFDENCDAIADESGNEILTIIL